VHPAYSVIFFTTLSGAGYGLLIWLAFVRISGYASFGPAAGLVTGIVALALVTTGLLSSSLHLGHPERAWRAFSQWRTSWLSREGVAAVVTYVPALLLIGGWWPGWPGGPATQLAALATLVMSLVTVACTGMIYASLKTIPRWSNPWVLPLYLLFSLASGGMLLALALAGSHLPATPFLLLLLATLLTAWIVKWLYWRFIDTQKPASTTGTATGLGRFGEVRQLEAPHTSENYLLREMGYSVARKHAGRLRRIAMVLGLFVPAVFVVVAMQLDGLARIGLLSLTLLSGFTGIIIERWLFFAEARHAVTLFYGRSLG